ncbi:MAG: DUF4124 domain-containing protein [Magnetococcales bacterium]|nr:DUF4124 domain-containing protein [Magnetococcales bacterium]
MIRRRVVCFSLGMLLAAPAWGASVYRCQDESGNRVFSDKPCKGMAQAPSEITPTGNVIQAPSLPALTAPTPSPAAAPGTSPPAAAKPATAAGGGGVAGGGASATGNKTPDPPITTAAGRVAARRAAAEAATNGTGGQPAAGVIAPPMVSTTPPLQPPMPSVSATSLPGKP